MGGEGYQPWKARFTSNELLRFAHTSRPPCLARTRSPPSFVDDAFVHEDVPVFEGGVRVDAEWNRRKQVRQIGAPEK